jgi:hypothetical protein
MQIPCPICKKIILSTALKCGHCQEWLNTPQRAREIKDFVEKEKSATKFLGSGCLVFFLAPFFIGVCLLFLSDAGVIEHSKYPFYLFLLTMFAYIASFYILKNKHNM